MRRDPLRALKQARTIVAQALAETLPALLCETPGCGRETENRWCGVCSPCRYCMLPRERDDCELCAECWRKAREGFDSSDSFD